MIHFVVSRGHEYTLTKVVEATGRLVKVISYDELVERAEVPISTYVFTDADRLSASGVRLASAIYRKLRRQGLRVLNDPAQQKTRFGLLRALHEAGINRFNAYRVDERVRPERWPVFMRLEGDHDKMSDLLHNWEEVRETTAKAIAVGMPERDLVIIEYAAESVRPGLFRRLSTYRMGRELFAATCAHDTTWAVKYGKKGIAGEDLYEEELRIVRSNPFRDQVLAAFEVANVEYGRADFGLVGGKVQIYEINTNPHIRRGSDEHPSPLRLESQDIVWRNTVAAVRSLDTPDQAGNVPSITPFLDGFRPILGVDAGNAARSAMTL